MHTHFISQQPVASQLAIIQIHPLCQIVSTAFFPAFLCFYYILFKQPVAVLPRLLSRFEFAAIRSQYQATVRQTFCANCWRITRYVSDKDLSLSKPRLPSCFPHDNALSISETAEGSGNSPSPFPFSPSLYVDKKIYIYLI